MQNTSCTLQGKNFASTHSYISSGDGRQHDVVPQLSLVSDVTHVALAFMRSGIFNEPNPTSWPLFTTVEDVRPKFKDGTKIMVAIGGWGDTDNFATAARSEESRQLFAENIKHMLDATGADGKEL